jgi:hypothetical protein|tara:strand:- start:1535 stop:2095 length:561 start_codon:yes stop_codon:yes gene_type:complete
MNEQQEMMMEATIAEKDNFAPAPPGHSLTLDNERWPWGKPPRDVDPEMVLEQAINSLEAPKTKQEMFKLAMVGVSIESMVEGYIFQGFQDGRFSPDVGTLIKGPLALHIASMCEENDIPYRFFENEDEMTQDEMSDKTFFRMMQENNPMMFSYIQETMNEGLRKGMSPQPVTEENFISMTKQEKEK